MRKGSFLILLALAACAKHKDFPPAIDVIPPPIPRNLTVEMPEPGRYELDWSVEDSTLVSYYRVYIYDPFTGPAELDTTRVSEFYYTFPIAVTAVVWGVSSVSVQNVESGIVYGSAP